MALFISFFITCIIFAPIHQIITIYHFKSDLKKYNAEMPIHYQIPVPEKFKDAKKLFLDYKKFIWRYRLQVYQYTNYIETIDDWG